MSISDAPWRTAVSVSATLVEVAFAPRGKPITVQTFTADPSSWPAANVTQYGLTHTLAKPYSRASPQSLMISDAVASARNSVWSINEAIFNVSGGMILLISAAAAMVIKGGGIALRILF